MSGLLDKLLFLACAVGFSAAVPAMLQMWLARRNWQKVRVTVTAIAADGKWICAVPTMAGPVSVQVPPFGEEGAEVGDTLELHHPPGRPEAARNGSGFGYLMAAVLSLALALVSWAEVLGLL